jgi:Mor family transcriptional regulator
MMSQNRYHAEFFDTFQDVAAQYGPEVAEGVMRLITMRHGGQQLRIPDPLDVSREDRNRQLRNRFTGFNHQELAILFKISVSQVRRIVQEG